MPCRMTRSKTPRLLPAARDLIRDFEGCKLDAYRDMAGIWTIGYGHTGPVLGFGSVAQAVDGNGGALTITEAQADKLLERDIAQVERQVRAALREVITERWMTDALFSAIVSLVFNVGIGAFTTSRAYAALMRGDLPTFCWEAFDKERGFTRVDGEIVPGLVRRRQAEETMAMAVQGAA